ncbi:MAG TPA: hypothetical protein VJH94_01135 [Candidatus Paceibacterota bacterium]
MFKRLIKKVSVKDADQKKLLVNAYNERCFWVYNGPVLSNLSDLWRAYNYMTKEQYAHHVHEEKNDFSKWVAEVLLDEECAKALLKADSPKKAATVVENSLKEYYV